MTRAQSFVLFGTFVLAACAEPTVPTPTLTRAGGVAFVEGEQQYVLIARNNALPAGLAASVEAAGGRLDRAQDFVALVSSNDPSFVSRASAIAGLEAVVPDQVFEFATPAVFGEAVEVEQSSHGPTGVGAHESFRNAQWNVDAINAPAAWNAGNLGAGARVAVLDGGIHAAHVDLDSRIDVARSVSFVPGFAFNEDVGPIWHGTHVAGILAAEANDIGTVGVAPLATIIGVKVLHNGTGNFGALIGAVLYASDPAGGAAHIINMSLGAYAVKHPSADKALVTALDRAMQIAISRGVTVVAAAGNDAFDLHKPKNQGLPKKLISIPAENHGVISVSATGPVGFALGATNFDRPASYTNFGKGGVTFAAPGGDFALPGTANCTIPRIGAGPALANQCWVFDMVLSTVRGGPTSIGAYNWLPGTSMASPVVAGVAALIVGKYGPLSPAQVEARLRESADDLGKPGNDAFYGHGRVNAGRAVGQ